MATFCSVHRGPRSTRATLFFRPFPYHSAPAGNSCRSAPKAVGPAVAPGSVLAAGERVCGLQAAVDQPPNEELPVPTIKADKQPVAQITLVDVAPGEQEEALGMMRERARFMATRPGFISISLHRSLDGRRIVNYVQWQSRELLHAAHKSPEFRKEWGRFDELTETIDPHLYEVAAVFEAESVRSAAKA
jgi:heme-degrading monooxygenase HmoA